MIEATANKLHGREDNNELRYFDWIAHRAEVRGDQTALIDLATRRRLAYRAFDERIDRLARFKCPHRMVFIDALPRNATGKVHKPMLRQKFLQPEKALS